MFRRSVFFLLALLLLPNLSWAQFSSNGRLPRFDGKQLEESQTAACPSCVLGVFDDIGLTQNSGTAVNGEVFKEIYVGILYGQGFNGLRGLEFSVSGINDFIVLEDYLNDPNVVIGNIPAPEDMINGVGGVAVAWPTCQTGNLALARVTLVNLSPTWPQNREMTVLRRFPPTSPNFPFPSFFQCDDPFFTQTSVTGGTYILNPTVACPPCVDVVAEIANGEPSVCPNDSFPVVSTATNCASEISTIQIYVDGVLREVFSDVPPGGSVTNTTVLVGCNAAAAVRPAPNSFSKLVAGGQQRSGASPAITPIDAIQNNPGAYVGLEVTVQAQVYIPTNYINSRFSGYIQDGSGRGINLFGNSANDPALFDTGNIVEVTGRVETFFTTVEIIDITNVTLVSSGNPPLQPALLSTGNAASSAWEGTFIQCTGTIYSIGTTGGTAPATNYTINDGSGPVVVRVVDDVGAPSFSVGQTITGRGAGGAFQSDFQILVGHGNDVFEGQAGQRTVTVQATANISGCGTVSSTFQGTVICGAEPGVQVSGAGPNAACPGESIPLSVSGLTTSVDSQNLDVYINGELVDTFANVPSGQPFASSVTALMPACSGAAAAFPYLVIAQTQSCGLSSEFSGSIVVDCQSDSLCVPPGEPPDCSQAQASPSLWPPNHSLVDVAITGVTDPDGDPVSIEITGVTSDEPVDAGGDGSTCPDAFLNGATATVRAERSGNGNGRVYTLQFTATDSTGKSCEGSVTVCVPHDQGGDSCVQDATQYDATVCPLTKSVLTSDATTHEPRIRRDAGRGIGIAFSQKQPGPVQVSIYDLRGRLVRRLVPGNFLGIGEHTFWWDAKNGSGLRVAAGLYLFRLTTQEREQTLKVVLTR